MPAAGEKVVPEPLAKPGEAKSAVGKTVVPELPAKPGEAKPAVEKKVVSEPAAKSGETNPAVGEIIVPEPQAKPREAKSTAEEKLTSKQPAKVGEAKQDVADEHASELASVIEANRLSLAALLFSETGPVRSSTTCGATKPAESLQLPTGSRDQNEAVKKPTLASKEQPRAEKPKNLGSAIKESAQRLTTNNYQKRKKVHKLRILHYITK